VRELVFCILSADGQWDVFVFSRSVGFKVPPEHHSSPKKLSYVSEHDDLAALRPLASTRAAT